MKSRLFCIFLSLTIQLFFSSSFASKPNKIYNIKYVLDKNGNAIKDATTMRVTPNRIYVTRNGQEKYWDCVYKGIEYDKRAMEKGKKVGVHIYYLVNKKVNIVISDYKLYKHNGEFYYLINIDGQNQLAL